MSPAARKLLDAADDAVNWEAPDGWLEQYGQGMPRVRRTAAEPEACVGEPLALDDRVPDASHFAELHLFGPLQDWGQPVRLGIQFSAFGGLVTIWGNQGWELDRQTVA